MGRLKLLWALVSHYKYAITIVVGILLVGFVDENSFMHRVQLEMQISDLTDEYVWFTCIGAKCSRPAAAS